MLAACSGQKFDDAMENGIEAVEKEKYDKGVKYFKEALEHKKDNEKANTYLEQAELMIEGISLYDEGQLEEARQKFNAINDLTDGLESIADSVQEKIKDIEEKESVFKDVGKLYEEAEKQNESGNYEKAINTVNEALENDLSHPYFERINNDLENLKKESEDYYALKEDAKKSYDKAENLKKDKKYGEAIKEIDQALEKDFSHQGLKVMKKELRNLKKNIIAKKKEVELQKQKDEMMDSLIGYWLEGDGLPGGLMLNITKDYITWAVISSDNFDYYEDVEFIPDVSNNTITLITSNDKAVLKLQNNQLIWGEERYNKVDVEKLEEVSTPNIAELLSIDTMKKIKEESREM